MPKNETTLAQELRTVARRIRQGAYGRVKHGDFSKSDVQDDLTEILATMPDAPASSETDDEQWPYLPPFEKMLHAATHNPKSEISNPQ